MKIRKAVGLAFVAALGAATVVLPAVASSETAPSVKAENYGESHYWRPPTVTVAPGGTVEFSNPTGVPHGIHWVSTPGATPVCSGSVPVGTEQKDSGTNWSGGCTFAAAGTYTYYCTVHGAAMTGTVTVGSPATTGPTGTTTPGGTTTSGTSTTGTTTTGASGPGGAPTGSGLLALKLGTAKGPTVHGSYTIGGEAAGGTITIAITAKLGGHRLQVGRLTRTYLNAGTQRWSIALSPRARRALHAKRRLALTVRVRLTPPGGTTTGITRALTVRA